MHLESHEVFRSVVDCGSITKAAAQLHMTQSTASRHLQALEFEYGGRLLDRSTAGLSPTPLGLMLYPYSCDLLNCHARAKEELMRLRNQMGSLCIGASLSIGEYMLPEILGAFRTRHTGAEIRMRVSNTEQIVRDLLNHRVDVGLVEGVVENHVDVLAYTWQKDELVLVCPPDHPFARTGHVSVEELTTAPLLMREEGSGTRQVTERALEDAGVGPLPLAMELGSTQAIKSGMEAGLGVAFLSRWTVIRELENGRLCEIAVDGLRIERELQIIARAERYPKMMVEDFVSMLRQPAVRG